MDIVFVNCITAKHVLGVGKAKVVTVADSLHDVLKADSGKVTVSLPYFNLIQHHKSLTLISILRDSYKLTLNELMLADEKIHEDHERVK